VTGKFAALGRLLSDALCPEEFKCISCGAELREAREFCLCPRCREILEFNKRFCQTCGVRLKDEADYCQTCKASPRAFVLARAACVYSGAARDMTVALKNGNGWIAKHLAGIMAARYPYGGVVFGACMPVPVEKKRLAERGFNQSALIAKALCRILTETTTTKTATTGTTTTETPTTGTPTTGTAATETPKTETGGARGLRYIDGLLKIKSTEKQSLLSAKTRAENIKGVFALSPKCPNISGQTVLLIDDVYTTGATVSECAKILLRGGAKAVYVYTFATGTGK
jgi:predicted amidophosphoribosyltransferase